jgi:hypothetical protein
MAHKALKAHTSTRRNLGGHLVRLVRLVRTFLRKKSPHAAAQHLVSRPRRRQSIKLIMLIRQRV